MPVTGYTCYATYYQLAQTLDDDEQRGVFWCAVNDYMFLGIDREAEMENRVTKMAFIYAKSHLKHSIAQSDRSQKRTEKKPKRNQNKTKTEPKQNRTATETQQVQDKGQVQVQVQDKGQVYSAKFSRPTAREIDEYCAEKGIEIDAEQFIDYYTAQGWKLSNGNALKDWRAAVRNWHRRDSSSKRKGVPDEYRIYD